VVAVSLSDGIAGFAASCGALLAVAGASKVYRSARGMAGDTAIRRALRITRRRWQSVELAAGCAECVTGVVVIAGLLPVAGGGVMAALGAAFCALLGYARIRGVPGGCGCIEWRAPASAGERTVSWREIARSAMVLGAGVADAVAARGDAGALDGPWFGAGLLAGAVVLILLSVRGLWHTPVCHRPLWRPVGTTLRALTGHAVYAAMAASAGPLGPLARHRAAGCEDEFWFAPAAGAGQGHAVVFLVRRAAPDGALAVRASVRDAAPPA
jgi:hypothetical protein